MVGMARNMSPNPKFSPDQAHHQHTSLDVHTSNESSLLSLKNKLRSPTTKAAYPLSAQHTFVAAVQPKSDTQDVLDHPSLTITLNLCNWIQIQHLNDPSMAISRQSALSRHQIGPSSLWLTSNTTLTQYPHELFFCLLIRGIVCPWVKPTLLVSFKPSYNVNVLLIVRE